RQGGVRVDGPGGERPRVLPLRHEPAGQRERRPRGRALRHRAVVCGEGRADRVPEDVLTRIMREHTRTLTPTLSLSDTLRRRGSHFDALSPSGGEGQGEGARTTRNAYS